MNLREAEIINQATWIIINQVFFRERGWRTKIEDALMMIDNNMFDLKMDRLIFPGQGEFYTIKRYLNEVYDIFEQLTNGEVGDEGWAGRDVAEACKND